jgi:hypothetical protein
LNRRSPRVVGLSVSKVKTEPLGKLIWADTRLFVPFATFVLKLVLKNLGASAFAP